MAKVLVIEDEAAIADTLLFSLRSEGHEVQWLHLAQAAWKKTGLNGPAPIKRS